MSNKTLAPSAVVVTDRDPKGIKFMSVAAAAFNKARLLDGEEGTPEGEAQRVNEAQGLADLITNYIEEHRYLNLYEDEEVPSKYGYFSGYKHPKPMHEQCEVLRKLFPGLGTAMDIAEDSRVIHQFGLGNIPDLPFAEGWFAIPNWVKHPEIFGTTYAEAVVEALDVLKTARNGAFYNYREGQITNKRVRQTAKKLKAFDQLSKEQGDPDILTVPAQFGLRHAGRSVHRATVKFARNEFGLGAFANIIMAITHPERLQHYDDLWIDCNGDEFDPDDDGEFSYAFYLDFSDGGVKFVAGDLGDANDGYGSTSGFLPQQPAS